MSKVFSPQTHLLFCGRPLVSKYTKCDCFKSTQVLVDVSYFKFKNKKIEGV